MILTMFVLKQNSQMRNIGKCEFERGEEEYKAFLEFCLEKGNNLDEMVFRNFDINKPFIFEEITTENWEKYCQKLRYQNELLKASKILKN